MISIFIILFIAWSISIIHAHFEKEIKNSNTIEDAIAIRKKFKRIRFLSIISFFISNMLVVIILHVLAKSVFDDTSLIIKILFFTIADFSTYGIILTAITWTVLGYTFGGGFYSFSQFNPINFLTISDFFSNIGHSNFSLYLRGFERDSYTGRNTEQYKENIFSEKLFVEQLSPIIQVYAVGMSKELTSPNGAIRVYLSDDYWKTDVLKMMNCAHSIFILINQKESCIWEIRQSLNMLEKVCFIIDDLSQYNTVRAQIENEIDFPEIKDGEHHLPFCMRILENYYNEKGETSQDSNLALIDEFYSNKDSYKKLFRNLLIPLKSNMQHLREQKQKGYVLLVSESYYNNDCGISKKECNNKQIVSLVFDKLSAYVPVVTYGNAVKKELMSEISQLSDIEKKDTVSKIMDDSQCIVLLITNTEDCVWELQECMHRKKKMVVIFSDYYICQYMRLKYPDFTDFRNIKIDAPSPFYCYYKNDKLVWNVFDNDNVLPMILDIVNIKIKKKPIPWTDIAYERIKTVL